MTLYFEVQSNSVGGCSARLIPPIGRLSDKPSSVSTNETGSGRYTCKIGYLLSDWAPSGNYYFTGIRANGTASYDQEVSVSVGSRKKGVKPFISSTKAYVSDNTLYFEVEAKSNAPVRRLRLNWSSPEGCHTGHVDAERGFEEVRPGVYFVKESVPLEEWSQNGEYQFYNTSVENEAFLASDPYSKVDRAFVYGNDDGPPVVKHISVSPDTFPATGGTVRLSVEVQSRAPIERNGTRFLLVDPNGMRTIWPSFSYQTTINPITYIVERDIFLHPDAPSGVYRVSIDSILNESCAAMEPQVIPVEASFTKSANLAGDPKAILDVANVKAIPGGGVGKPGIPGKSNQGKSSAKKIQ